MGRTSDVNSKGVSLLVSVLLCYPEVGSVDFNPVDQTLKFTFLFQQTPSRECIRQVTALLRDSLQVMHQLENHSPRTIHVESVEDSQLTVLSVLRDVATLSQSELFLVVNILREHYREFLVSDQQEVMLEEDMMVQEEIIAEMLEDVRRSQQHHNLTAFREDGRVVVFNK